MSIVNENTNSVKFNLYPNPATTWIEVELQEAAKSNITCLLYTSDAADERSSVDLGGRRIIKKKKKRKL